MAEFILHLNSYTERDTAGFQREPGRVVDLNASIALTAAKFGIEYQYPLADSVVFATARHQGAQVWTQDSDCENLPDVRFTPKR